MAEEINSTGIGNAPAGRPPNANQRINTLEKTVRHQEERIVDLESVVAELQDQLQGCRETCRELMEALVANNAADTRREMEEMRLQVAILQRAVSNAAPAAAEPMAGIRIPEPKPFEGKRDAKEVDNFLFDMEQYFLATKIESEARKVSTATMYLTDDAKLWWRTKYKDIQDGRLTIDTWAKLQEAIRQQFFPENVEYNARRALRMLKHTGSF